MPNHTKLFGQQITEKILAITKLVGITSDRELHKIFQTIFGKVSIETFKNHIAEAIQTKDLIDVPKDVLKNIPFKSKRFLLLGPSESAPSDKELWKSITTLGITYRDPLEFVGWEKLAAKKWLALEQKINELKSQLQGELSPKSKQAIEIKYFELTVEYHQLSNWFYGKIENNSRKDLLNILETLKEHFDSPKYII
ncbi:MAG: hypothetical protein HY929_00605 [Euryarchaeota archaeon]|nr:hypothetical protein [Euryarchaeota archaeon]